MKSFLLTSFALLLVITGFNCIQPNADREAVRDTVLDYIEGIYEYQPERIDRSVHPELAKIGYWMGEGDSEYSEHPMTFSQLRGMTARTGRRHEYAADAPKEIEIYDVLDKTASVKLTADWGVDYMHLVKLDGKWMIRNVIWQSHDRTED